MSCVTASDEARIFHQDWGAGSWESQALLLAGNGYRVIAHDRRGHGRSTQTWDGNERQWGFSDPTHFTRRFRAAHGITPSESTCRNGTGTG